MSLVDQIFEQAKLGTAVDPSANPFATGVQLGQHQQQLDQQKQQLAMELGQAELKKTLLQQQSQENALKIELGLKAKQDDIEATSAFTNLAGIVNSKLKEGKTEEAISEYTQGGIKNNVLFGHGPYLAAGKQLDVIQKEKDLALYRQGVMNERRFKDMPGAAKFEELAKQAEVAGDPDTAQMYRDHADLEIQKEARLQQQQQDVHQHNQIRLKQLEANIARTGNKAALAAFNSDLRNIENTPRMKLPERNAKVAELLKEYEDKYGTSAPATAPTAAPTSTTRFTPGTVYKDKFGNQREYQADGTWKVLPQ